jgi:hypothetical protein
MSTSKDTAKESENRSADKPGKKMPLQQLDKVSGGVDSGVAGASPKLGEGEEARLRKAE